MGGARAGEVASRLAAAALEERPPAALGEDALAALLREANRRISGALARRSRPRRAWARRSPPRSSTRRRARSRSATSATRAPTGCATACSSSSRPTTRSSPSSSAAGGLTPEEAEQHPQRSVITRALGTEPAVEVETLTDRRRARRPLPDLLRRAHRHASATSEIAAAIAGAERRSRRGGRGARRGGERRRRRGQHHGRPLRARRGRAATRCPSRPPTVEPDEDDAGAGRSEQRRHAGGRRRAGAAPRRRPGRPLARPRR